MPSRWVLRVVIHFGKPTAHSQFTARVVSRIVKDGCPAGGSERAEGRVEQQRHHFSHGARGAQSGRHFVHRFEVHETLLRFLKKARLLNRRSHLVGDSDQHLFFFVVVRVRAIGLNADDPDDLRADFHRDTEPGARHLHRAPRDRIQGVVLFFLQFANLQGFLSQHHVRTQPCGQRSADGLFADTLINTDAKIQFLGGGIVQRDAPRVAEEAPL